MTWLAVQLNLAYLMMVERLEPRPHDQRGTTVEQIAWTAFLVGLAVAAFVVFRNYTDGKLGVLK